MNHNQILKLFPESDMPERRLRILIVDDQTINIRVMHDILKEDYEVLMATDGQTAIDLCHSQLPDLILLDVVMPDMSGHDICKKLVSDPVTEHIPIIFVTSHSQDIDESFGLELGAVDFISKPINPITVKARIKNHLALKLQNDYLRSMAHIDGLTSVFNRRRFDEEINLSWRHCQREHQPLSLILIDLDYFKLFNDRYGHIAGDACLKSIAQALKNMPHRPRDLFARYGGEEFAYILPNTHADGAQHCAKRILNTIRELNIPHSESDVTHFMTVSVGVSTVIPDKTLSLLDFIEHTDQALYQAKLNGRNQFVFKDY
ncbi:diguanylate cyclase [Marinomonas agarivorans]|nr:diguanylate cyclase [Marinomonas agarivorans]